MIGFLQPFGRLMLGAGLGAALLIGGLAALDEKAPSLISPSYYRDQTNLFPAYDPALRSVPKHVLVSGCQLLPYVFNRPGDNGEESISSDAAKIENVANNVLRSVLPETRDRFFSFDYPNTVIPGHTRLVALALRSPDLRSLIYMNGPEGLSLNGFTTNPTLILEAIASAEQIAAETPEAQPYAKKFIEWLRLRPKYEEAIEKFGSNWRSRIRADLTLNETPYSIMGITNIKDAPHEIRRWLARFLGAPAGVLSRFLLGNSNLKDIRERAWDREIESKRELARGLLAVVDKPIESPSWDFKAAPVLEDDQEVYKAWFKMVAEATKHVGAKLVIYSAPHASITKSNHGLFRAQYFDRISPWLIGYNVSFIDNSLEPNLPNESYIFHCEKPECLPGRPLVTDGYHLNILGRLVQARLLVNSMKEAGLLRGDR